jgi:hypothetical protein
LALSLEVYVLICSLFGTLAITMTRILSLLLHTMALEFHASHFIDKKNSLKVRSSQNSSLNTTAINSTSELLKDTIIGSAHQSAVFPVIVLGLLLGLSMIGQESFKQEALTLYPVSKFQSLLYAGFNSFVILSHVFLFKEIPPKFIGHYQEWLWFITAFGTGLLFMAQGFREVSVSGADHGRVD